MARIPQHSIEALPKSRASLNCHIILVYTSSVCVCFWRAIESSYVVRQPLGLDNVHKARVSVRRSRQTIGHRLQPYS